MRFQTVSSTGMTSHNMINKFHAQCGHTLIQTQCNHILQSSLFVTCKCVIERRIYWTRQLQMSCKWSHGVNAWQSFVPRVLVLLARRWAELHGYYEIQTNKLVRFLDSKLLISLPMRTSLRRQHKPTGFRFLWHHHGTTALGWKTRRVEGDPRDFNLAINNFLRSK